MGLYARLLVASLVVVLAGCGSAGVTDAPEPTTAPTGTPTPLTGATPDPASQTAATPGEFVPSETVDVTVTRVVDGDTLDVRLPNGTEDTVRLVGIDTPEVHVENDPAEFEGVPDTDEGALCLRRAGHNATGFVEERLAGTNVTLAFDPRTDRQGGYDRLLAYVYVDGSNLNRELVAAGHARVYETAFSLREAFEAGEAGARSASRGLWTCRQRNNT